MSFDLKKILFTRFLFMFGVQMQAIVMGWQMYVLTKNPLFLGLIGLVEAIPALSLALYAGYKVDRGNPLQIYRHLILVSLLSGALFVFSQFLNEGEAIHLQIIALFASSFLSGLARAFYQPSLYALVPRMIPRDQIAKTSVWMTWTMQTARILGPALGGVAFGWGGALAAGICVCGVLSFASLISFLVPDQYQIATPQQKNHSVLEELFSGARFVFKHPILLPAMSLDMVSVLFGGVTALLPIYAAEILLVGPEELGFLRAAPAIGATLMGLLLFSKGIQSRAGAWLFTAVAGFGISILVFALSENYWLSLAALGLSGAFDSISMIVRGSAVQLLSPESMRGKISAVNSIFIGSSNELGEFESGVAAKFLGTVPAAVLGGVVCIVTVFILAISAPQLRRLNLNELSK